LISKLGSIIINVNDQIKLEMSESAISDRTLLRDETRQMGLIVVTLLG
jgi:hypothetical protein